MDKIVDYIGVLSFIGMLVFVGIASFNAGSALKEYPSDEEMFRHLVANRARARIEKEVEAALTDEVNRQAARS